MKKYILYTVAGVVLLLGTNQGLYSQGINLSDSSFIKISNSAYVIINTSSVNGIKETGTGGSIISEGETNRIKWNVGTATGVYTIPFRNDAGVEIPVSVNITTAGEETTAGSLLLSTYLTESDNTPWASDVTHMTNVGGGDNTLHTLDRFWIIEANDYSEKPSVILSLGYDPNEILAPNTITEANLQAQRFNSTSDTWGNWGPIGIVNTTDKNVNSITVSSTDFFRTWVLVDKMSPLPVTLVEFSAKCTQSGVYVNWVTLSESNNDFFTVERSDEGERFRAIKVLAGAGNSNTQNIYSIVDSLPVHYRTYYRLKQTDYDGTNNYSQVISVYECPESTNEDVFIYAGLDGTTTLVFLSEAEAIYKSHIYDLSGRVLWAGDFYVQEGYNSFELRNQGVGNGIYLLVLEGRQRVITRKIALR